MKALVNKVWPLTLSVAAFLVANAEAIGSLIEGHTTAAGEEFSTRSLLLILVGLLTMVRTYSVDSARKLALSEPHDLNERV